MSWVSASSASACRPRNRLKGWRGFADGDHALGDVLAEIADPLEIGRDADRADDLAQIVRHRLALGDHHDRLVVDLALPFVEEGVVADHLPRQAGIGIDERRHRLVDHALGMAAHGRNAVGEILQLLVERRGQCAATALQINFLEQFRERWKPLSARNCVENKKLERAAMQSELNDPNVGQTLPTTSP